MEDIKQVKLFEMWLRTNSKSKKEKSIQNVMLNVREFVSLMQITSIDDIRTLVPTDVQLYLSKLKERGNCDNTMKTKLARIRIFFNYLFEYEEIQKNIMKGKKVRCGDASVQKFEHSDVLKVMNAAETLRDYVMLHTLIGTGIRISELLDLECDKVFQDSRIQVFGKGGKWRIVECFPKVTEVLLDYIKKTQDVRKDSQLVFTTDNAKRIAENNVLVSFKRLAKKAGIPNWEEFSPHKIRHTYGDYSLNVLKIPIDIISVNMGHADVAVTSRVYARTNPERAREFISKVDEGRFFGRKELTFDDSGKIMMSEV